ncbi:MAG: hypothetical protein EBY56_01355 [Actinobacteria bacterium]|nr:hypothetical protein [Actinomycetota bacterium]
MPDQPRSEITSSERRSFDRLVNFTDAVVAIGITLQLLPIIDVQGPAPGESTIFRLNVAWLLLIVFLPWPTAMYGEEANNAVAGRGGLGLLYWWTLAAISGLGVWMAIHARRHVDLLAPDERDQGGDRDTRGLVRGYVLFASFVIVGLVSIFQPTWAPLVFLGAFPAVAVANRMVSRRNDQHTGTTQEAGT